MSAERLSAESSVVLVDRLCALERTKLVEPCDAGHMFLIT